MVTEDLAIFFGDFEGVALYTPTGNQHPSSMSAEIQCNFDNEYIDLEQMIRQAPNIETHAGEVSSPAVGDKLRMFSTRDTESYVDYIVREIQPDGSGVYLLILEVIE